MRRGGLVGIVVLVLALALAGGALSRVPAGSARPIVCISPSALLYANGGVEAAGGECHQGKAVVPSTVFYAYSSADSSGASCGTMTGKGRRIGIDPAPATLRSRFGIAPRSKPSRITWGRWSSSSPGGDSWQCGRLLNLPSVGQLCPWTTPISTRFDTNCGKSAGAVAWSTPPTISGNTISAGHVASRSGACYLTSGTAGGLLDAPAVSFTWLGFTDQAETLVCSNRVLAHGGIAYVELVNPVGQRCWGAPPHPGAWRFKVPPSWGGTLYVYFDIGVATDLATDSKSGNGPVEETGILPLSGTADGCYQLQPGWHP